MSFGRRWFVNGLVAIVLGGNLASFIFNRQLWPFSPYPMFADTSEEDLRTFETLALVGEPVDGGEIWFELPSTRHENGVWTKPLARRTLRVRCARPAG